MPAAEIYRLRRHAERCLELSQSCTSQSVAESLVALAAEYLDRATKLAPKLAAVARQQVQPVAER
jgi:hypothetical protein